MKPLVSIIDDDETIRDSLRCLLDSIQIPSVGYATGQAFVDRKRQMRPGCVLLDLRIPDMSGLEVQRNLTEMEGHLPVIFMSGYGDVETSVSAMRAGAANFLTKPVEAETLLANVRGAIEQSRTLLAKFQQQESVRSRRALLTPRETDVLNEIVTGRSNKQVARLLGISPKTVELHRANVMHKMHADSLAELVRLHLTAAGDIAQANSNESLQQADAGD